MSFEDVPRDRPGGRISML